MNLAVSMFNWLFGKNNLSAQYENVLQTSVKDAYSK